MNFVLVVVLLLLTLYGNLIHHALILTKVRETKDVDILKYSVSILIFHNYF